MALHFSANQYEKAFQPKLLQNWEVPQTYRERPRQFDGFTQVVSNNRGHLLSGVKRSRESPWGTFVGTWDMPIQIPGNSMLNRTARSSYAAEKLHRMKTDGDLEINGKLKHCKIPDALAIRYQPRVTQLPHLDRSPPLITTDPSRNGAKAPVPSKTPRTPEQDQSPRSPIISPKDNVVKSPVISHTTPRPATSPHAENVLSPKPNTPALSPKPNTPVLSPKPTSPKDVSQNAIARSPINWPRPQSQNELIIDNVC